MIQYADLVAYAVRSYYEKGDASLFDIISHRFDAEGGVIHGLRTSCHPGQDVTASYAATSAVTDFKLTRYFFSVIITGFRALW
jgi:hypothetical protein